MARIQQGGIKRVLVVCYGNVYRSPFAGTYLRQSLPAEIEVRSVGFHHNVGRPSPERHVTMSRARNVDLSAHRSAQIGADDLQWADIIVLMDRDNWDRLEAVGADPAKYVWLGAFGPGNVEIDDPYEVGDEHAARVLDQLETASRELTARIRTGHQLS